MPEPITIVAGVTTIVGKVFQISKDVSDLVNAIENAPKHILAVSQDVRSLYGVLGSLQGLLQDLEAEELPENVAPIFESLQKPLDHCLWAFQVLQMRICKYTKPTGDIRRSKWVGFWWQFKEKEANAYRAHLASYKLTVDVALAAANLANTSQTIRATHILEREIKNMQAQLDGMENNGASGQCQSFEADNGSQITDSQFALRRFLETVETVFSGSPPLSPTLSARSEGILSLPGPPVASRPVSNIAPTQRSRSGTSQRSEVADQDPTCIASIPSPEILRNLNSTSAPPTPVSPRGDMTLVKRETAKPTASPIERRMNFIFNAGTGGFTTTEVDQGLAGDMDMREEHISEHTGVFFLEGSTQGAKVHKTGSDASPDDISSSPKLCSTEANGKKSRIDSKSQPIGDVAGDKVEPRNSCTDQTSDETLPDPERKSESANWERHVHLSDSNSEDERHASDERKHERVLELAHAYMKERKEKGVNTPNLELRNKALDLTLAFADPLGVIYNGGRGF